MQPAFDTSSVIKTLQHGIDAGYWTLEDLDHPPKHHINPSDYRNLLRDANPSQTVVISEPRDFTPTATTVGTVADSFRCSSPSVLLDAHRAVDEAQHHPRHQQQNAQGDATHQRDQRWPAGMGHTWDHNPRLHGTVPDDW